MRLEEFGTINTPVTVETELPCFELHICCEIGCTEAATSEFHILFGNPNKPDYNSLIAIWLCEEHEKKFGSTLVIT